MTTNRIFNYPDYIFNNQKRTFPLLSLLTKTSPRWTVSLSPRKHPNNPGLFPPPTSRDLERQQKKQLSGTIYHPPREIRSTSTTSERAEKATTLPFSNLLACQMYLKRTSRVLHHSQNPSDFRIVFHRELIPRAGHFDPGTTASERRRRRRR